MPFDPTLPANNSPRSSAEMRSQLTGLKDLIDQPETDPVFAASEAALLVPGDKAKLDSAVQPGTLDLSLNNVIAHSTVAQIAFSDPNTMFLQDLRDPVADQDADTMIARNAAIAAAFAPGLTQDVVLGGVTLHFTNGLLTAVT